MDVVIIEDNADLAENLRTFLTLMGFKIKVALTAEDGLRKTLQHAPRVVLLDHHLPDAMGLDLLPRLIEASPESAIVMVTAAGSEQIAVDAIKRGAVDYLPKPVALDELRQIVGTLTLEPRSKASRHRLRLVQDTRIPGRGSEASSTMQASAEGTSIAPVQTEGRGLPDPLDRIIGNSDAMKDLRRRLRQLARSEPAHVLITGEQGSGKELAARALHDSFGSGRSPFLVMNCAGIPDASFDTELACRTAHVFAAPEGHAPATLFLDDISLLGPSAQNTLLQLVNASAGSGRRIRVIAASAHCLETALRCGSFRDSLYYRLRSRRIRIPALRERPGDSRILAEHFLLQQLSALGQRNATLSGEALQAIEAYAWPGNIRELQSRIARALTIESGPVISAAALGLVNNCSDPTVAADESLRAC